MTTLADVTRRVDRFIVDAGAVILAIVNGLTAEGRYVAALFDGADDEGMQIYRELGFEAEVDPRGATVLDILKNPLDGALGKHHYVPIDELPGYEPATVLLYVFTMGVVVVRRFEKGAGAITTLREVRRTRDVEIRSGLAVEGRVAIDALVQRSAPVLQKLRDPGSERVALIAKVSRGAKVGYIERGVAVDMIRELGARSPPKDRDWCLSTADALAGGPKPGKVACIIEGWGPIQLIWLDARTLDADAPRYWDEEDDAMLHEWIVACRDQKRALGLLEKCLDKLGESSPASTSLAELISLVRHAWLDFAAIEAQIPVVLEAATSAALSPAGLRLRGALLALTQATTERKRGGAVNARGGRA